MAVRIVLDGPSRGAGPRLGRVLAVVAGLPLVVAGVAGLYGIILIGIFLVYVSPGPAKDQRDAILTGAVCAAAALAGLGLGLRLLRGRRRLVLFLRRFGFDDATRAVSFAAAGAIGRSWRLVTLDDDKVRAVGGASGPRRLAGVTALTRAGAAGLRGVVDAHPQHGQPHRRRRERAAGRAMRRASPM